MAEALEAGTEIELSFESAEKAEIICNSLKPEELLPKSARAEIDVSIRKNILSLNIDARDTAALRAAVNSFLRWAAVARDMTEL